MIKQIKVLHVITTINRGGAENHLIALAREQRFKGCDVSVVYLKGNGYWSEAYRELGIDIISLNLSSYAEIYSLLRLRRIIHDIKPDIVHAHMPPAELFVRLAMVGIGSSFAFLITKHNDEPFYGGPGWRLLARWVALRASYVIAISNAVNLYVQNTLGLKHDRIVTIHYGIDPSLFCNVSFEQVSGLRRVWSDNNDTLLIGTVARLVPQKALHILIQGYSEYRNSAKRPSRLVIIGTGLLKEDLKALADNLGIGGEIVWVDFRDDIQVVMRALDLFALTSIYEGFGLVLIEAMAASRPVIASGVSAIPEVVLDKETGILVPPLDISMLAKAILFFESDERRDKYGAAGYERVVSNFSLDQMIMQTMGVYKLCLK